MGEAVSIAFAAAQLALAYKLYSSQVTRFWCTMRLRLALLPWRAILGVGVRNQLNGARAAAPGTAH